jgi:CDP-glycerol glycerophosphotransferase
MHPWRVVFFSHFGSQYSCNPKYLSEYLEAHAPDVELVWAFEDPDAFGFLRERGIRLVRYNSMEFVRACLGSRFLVTNCEVPAWLPVRRGQVLMNTWHGGGAYKRVGSEFDKGSYWRNLRSAMGRRKTTVYLSSSDAFTELTVRQSMQHAGEVLCCGMPRNDILVLGNEPGIDARVRERLGIPAGDRVLLYAPTYREGRAASTYLFDCGRVRAALVERFGGTWTILLRMHYFVMQQLPASDAYLDASAYPDMQELLYMADVLVTDYSSSIWDFGLTGKPCLLYAPDLSEYDAERGFYSDIRTWPWPLSQSNEELARAIRAFDEDDYARRLHQHYVDLGSTETGHAREAVAAYLLR